MQWSLLRNILIKAHFSCTEWPLQVKWFSVCYISLIWKEVWKTFCMSEQRALFAPRQLQHQHAPDSESWQSPVCWTDSGLLTCLARHLLSLSSASFFAGLCSIWLIERTVPVCRLAISTDVHALSVKKWPFNNTASFPACAQGPVGHYRAITSEILVWTSGGKLMCYCDERFSLWALKQEPEQER